MPAEDLGGDDQAGPEVEVEDVAKSGEVEVDERRFAAIAANAVDEDLGRGKERGGFSVCLLDGILAAAVDASAGYSCGEFRLLAIARQQDVEGLLAAAERTRSSQSL